MLRAESFTTEAELRAALVSKEKEKGARLRGEKPRAETPPPPRAALEAVVLEEQRAKGARIREDEARQARRKILAGLAKLPK